MSCLACIPVPARYRVALSYTCLHSNSGFVIRYPVVLNRLPYLPPYLTLPQVGIPHSSSIVLHSPYLSSGLLLLFTIDRPSHAYTQRRRNRRRVPIAYVPPRTDCVIDRFRLLLSIRVHCACRGRAPFRRPSRLSQFRIKRGWRFSPVFST